MGMLDMGPLGMMPPLVGGAPRDLGWGMVGAASMLGTPGYSLGVSSSPLIAGLGWSSGPSSYWGTSGFRGVADIAEASNNYQRGWPMGYGLSSGLGVYGLGGIGAPMVGTGYYTGPGPGYNSFGSMFNDPMFAWMYGRTFGAQQQQQPAGPAQPAAPQPAPAAAPAKGEEKAADGSGGAAKKGRAVHRGGGHGGHAAPVTPKIAAEFQDLLAKLQAVGGNPEKMDPKDLRRLKYLAKKYPSLLKGAKKAGKAVEPEPDHDAQIEQKRKLLAQLEKIGTERSLTAQEEQEYEQLKADPSLK